jgi:hypothetical protein
LKFLEAEFLLGGKGFLSELLIDSAVSLLVDLETAQQERSMLLSDEPKATGKRKEKRVCVEYQIVWYRRAFLQGEPFALPVLDAFGSSLQKQHCT